MHDRILNPTGIEESLLVLRLACQGADAFYLAEIRLAEKMKRPVSLNDDWTMYEMVCANPIHAHSIGWVMIVGGGNQEVVCPECGEARHSKFGRSVLPDEGTEAN